MKIVIHPFVNPIKITKMKYDIHKTAVVPYIIAERAVWNVLEADKRFKDATPNQMAEIVNRLNEPLVKKAEHIFNANNHFRMQLLNKRNDIRYMLEMFMEHWTLALLKKEHIKILTNQ